MSYKIIWLPYEPVCGAECKWEVVVRRYGSPTDRSAVAIREKCRLFDTKEQADRYLHSLNGIGEERGTVTIRATEW